mmetsp:Transcript_28326/g.88274  ORF Transcript_28326/g.88274 Transcript_28326/m.88274 type:complete len:308 (-) Transcript_28326:15-938(-)
MLACRPSPPICPCLRLPVHRRLCQPLLQQHATTACNNSTTTAYNNSKQQLQQATTACNGSMLQLLPTTACNNSVRRQFATAARCNNKQQHATTASFCATAYNICKQLLQLATLLLQHPTAACNNSSVQRQTNPVWPLLATTTSNINATTAGNSNMPQQLLATRACNNSMQQQTEAAARALTRRDSARSSRTLASAQAAPTAPLRTARRRFTAGRRGCAGSRRRAAHRATSAVLRTVQRSFARPEAGTPPCLPHSGGKSSLDCPIFKCAGFSLVIRLFIHMCGTVQVCLLELPNFGRPAAGDQSMKRK